MRVWVDALLTTPWMGVASNKELIVEHPQVTKRATAIRREIPGVHAESIFLGRKIE
jgi:hypothetical protein